MSADPGEPGRFRWDAGRVAPGHYTLAIEEPEPKQIEIDVPTSGRSDVRINFGRPVDVVARVVDGESGAPIAEGSLEFRLGDREYSTSRSVDEEGVVRWRSSATRLELIRFSNHPSSQPPDFWILDERRVALRVGRNELTVRVEPTCGIHFSMTQDGQSFEWPEDLAFEVSALPAEWKGTPSFAYEVSTRYPWCWVEEPGHYRVEFAPVAGFEPIDPFEIDIPRGTFVERSIALVEAR
jgi:hypothetical protein